MTRNDFKGSHRMRSASASARRYEASAARRAHIESRRLEALSGACGFSESGEIDQLSYPRTRTVLTAVAILALCYAVALFRQEVASIPSPVDPQEMLYVDEGQDGAPAWWKAQEQSTQGGPR